MTKFYHIPIKPSADDKAFADYAANCRKLWGIEQPKREVFERVTRPMSDSWNLEIARASNRTGG